MTQIKNDFKSSLYWLWVSGVVILFDQLSKFLILKHLNFGESLRLVSFLNFTLDQNKGAAFSFLNQAGGWQTWFLASIAIIVSMVILLWLKRLPRKEFWTGLGLSLILGGALGNLIDRFIHGFVVDFIDFHIKNWHFAVFNIADSAISIGAIIMIGSVIFRKN